MTSRAFICGLSGPVLGDAEKGYLERWLPAGLILFARNIESPEQVRSLIASARALLPGGSQTLMLIDQEGGRVQRLGPPHWPRYPAASLFGALYKTSADEAKRLTWLCARLMARDLHELGINAACAPVLDVPVPGADGVIGDRAYGTDPRTITDLGETVADALLAGGVLPIVKHIPGHGRAMTDSHFALPVAEASLASLIETDFQPFKALCRLPVAMTAHVVFPAVDEAPVTLSKAAVDRIIREEIGFAGLLLSDDLSMNALSGALGERAKRAFEAGCDIALHCNGRMHEMIDVAKAAPMLEGVQLERLRAALGCLKPPEAFDANEAEDARVQILAAAPAS